MKRYLALCAISVVCIAATKKAPLLSLREKNIQADTAFLKWKLDAPHSEISPELHKLLTPEAQAYLVKESQLPLTSYFDQKELKEKVYKMVDNFLAHYNPKGTIAVKRYELEELVNDLVAPEYVLQIHALTDTVDKEPHEILEAKHYNELLEGLSRYKTTAGTFLNEWALRYLTSEAQLIALEIIERETRNGKSFNELPDPKRVELVGIASEEVTRRFMHNLGPVRRKFGFRVPPYADMAVKKRVNQFLREKFGL